MKPAMHPLLIDWLRRVSVNADVNLGTKRWTLAQRVRDQLSRAEVIQFLKYFLLPGVHSDLLPALTKRFLDADPEFPASQNSEDVRLMAGVVMVASFSSGSDRGSAFALGIKAARFQGHRCKDAHKGVASESETFLSIEANRVRPLAFSESDDRTSLKAQLLMFMQTEVQQDPSLQEERADDLSSALDDLYGSRLRRLAEECGLLWWIVGEFSPTLSERTRKLSDRAYALVAADEAATRTTVLPPSPSAHALLAKALSVTKSKDGRSTLSKIVAEADETWRAAFVSGHPISDCESLLPLMTALGKTNSAGSVDVLKLALPAACHGVSADMTLEAVDASTQLFDELMFVEALRVLG